MVCFSGVPLVLESNSWQHGVMVGACVKSESTAAAEHTGEFNLDQGPTYR